MGFKLVAISFAWLFIYNSLSCIPFLIGLIQMIDREIKINFKEYASLEELEEADQPRPRHKPGLFGQAPADHAEAGIADLDCFLQQVRVFFVVGIADIAFT